MRPTACGARRANDTLFGRRRGRLVYGGDGADLLQGDPGTDTLHGEGGADRIVAGSENDWGYGAGRGMTRSPARAGPTGSMAGPAMTA